MFVEWTKHKYIYFILLFIIIVLLCFTINKCMIKKIKNIEKFKNYNLENNNLNLQIKNNNNNNFNQSVKKTMQNLQKDDNDDVDDDDAQSLEDEKIRLKFFDDKKNEYVKNNGKKIELVLARYNENVDYLLNYEFDDLKIHLYNKGGVITNEEILNNKNIIIYQLPNVGKCDHTYLYHIINNYNNLPDIIIFLPASFYYMKFKRYKGLRILKDTKEKEKPVYPVNKLNTSNYQSFYNFKISYFKTRFQLNQFTESKTNYNTKLSPIRPYGKWFKQIFDKEKYKKLYKCDYVIYTGMFSVSKEVLLKYDLDLYKKLMTYVDYDINPEAGHFIERAWACMFYPFKNSLIINT